MTACLDVKSSFLHMDSVCSCQGYGTCWGAMATAGVLGTANSGSAVWQYPLITVRYWNSSNIVKITQGLGTLWKTVERSNINDQRFPKLPHLRLSTRVKLFLRLSTRIKVPLGIPMDTWTSIEFYFSGDSPATALRESHYPLELKVNLWQSQPQRLQKSRLQTKFWIVSVDILVGFVGFFFFFFYCTNTQRGNFIFPVIFIKVKFQTSLAQLSFPKCLMPLERL